MLISKYHKIKFICELERYDYLSIFRYRINGNKITSIYRKPTFTGISLNWFDSGPMNYKINSIKTLSNRAYDLTSNYF